MHGRLAAKCGAAAQHGQARKGRSSYVGLRRGFGGFMAWADLAGLRQSPPHLHLDHSVSLAFYTKHLGATGNYNEQSPMTRSASKLLATGDDDDHRHQLLAADNDEVRRHQAGSTFLRE